MRIVIRTDSSKDIGSGHIMRCLTLARFLRKSGNTIHFVCRELAGNFIDKVESEGFEVFKLSPPAKNEQLEGYLTWLGVSENTDALETNAVLFNHHYDWLVVDHYALAREWETTLRDKAKKIMVIDDLANRPHDCDVLLDQNYFGEQADFRYKGLISSECNALLGPHYALLQPEYHQLRRINYRTVDKVNRILVFFGGSDINRHTKDVVLALCQKEFSSILVDVVIGKNHPNPAEVIELVNSRPGTSLYRNLASLAGLIYRADLFIGAGGATTWERMCLGVPALIVATAQNQKQFTDALEEGGYQVTIDAKTGVSPEVWKQTLLSLVEQTKRLNTMSQRSELLVDGLGVYRAAKALSALEVGDLTMSSVEVQNELTNTSNEHQGSGVRLTKQVIYKNALPLGVIEYESDGSHHVTQIVFDYESIDDSDALSTCFLEKGLEYWNYCHTKSNHSYLKYRDGVQEQLKISILSDGATWSLPTIFKLQAHWLSQGYCVRWVDSPDKLIEGDVCYILSCSRILKKDILSLHKHNIVVHASDLPNGRGWSPMTWQILEGKHAVCVSLFEAVEKVDEGVIYKQHWIKLKGDELIDEWREKLSETTRSLCEAWIEEYPSSVRNAKPQIGEGSYYERRRPVDSRLDPDKSIKEQLNLLRVVDNSRYPAYVDIEEVRYFVSIRKAK